MLNIRVHSNVKPSARPDLRFGELALESGVPETALRYYKKAGLLSRTGRTAAGYRCPTPKGPERNADPIGRACVMDLRFHPRWPAIHVPHFRASRHVRDQ